MTSRLNILNSNTSSKISQNSAGEYIDRSTCAQKAKPNNERPVVESKDDDSEIYEGEEASEFIPDENEVVIEEFYQSVNTSNPTEGIIPEANSELESSRDAAKNTNLVNYQELYFNSSPEEEDFGQKEEYKGVKLSDRKYKRNYIDEKIN